LRQCRRCDAAVWAEYGQLGIDHLTQVQAILDAEELDYRN